MIRIRTTSARATVVGLLTAFIGVMAMPLSAGLEANLGLSWLFWLRGPRPVPVDVVIVGVDQEAADALGLLSPEETLEWPRSLHARLMEKLVSEGARVIAFDLFFSDQANDVQGGKQDDLQFAQAISQAGNVVLLERLIEKEAPENIPIELEEQRKQPLPLFAEKAAALAPLPLPKVPVKVSQCWFFRNESGDIATLPAVVFQLYAGAGGDALHLFRELISISTSGTFQTGTVNYMQTWTIILWCIANQDIGVISRPKR